MDEQQLWKEWQERIVRERQFVPPEVWFGNLAPKPYAFINHRQDLCAGYTMGPSPGGFSLLDYRHRNIMVWWN